MGDPVTTSILIGAAVGGTTSAIAGKDPLSGAVIGGATGGAGGALFGGGAAAGGELIPEVVSAGAEGAIPAVAGNSLAPLAQSATQSFANPEAISMFTPAGTFGTQTANLAGGMPASYADAANISMFTPEGISGAQTGNLNGFGTNQAFSPRYSEQISPYTPFGANYQGATADPSNSIMDKLKGMGQYVTPQNLMGAAQVAGMNDRNAPQMQAPAGGVSAGRAVGGNEIEGLLAMMKPQARRRANSLL